MKKVTTLWSVWAVSMIAGLSAWGWNSISVPGDAFAAGWSTDANNLTNHEGSVWSGYLTVKGAGDFKFAADHKWDNNWGTPKNVGVLTIERLPAHGVGPLEKNGSNNPDPGHLRLAVDVAQTIHFAFDEDALTCDLTGVAPPAVTSVKLIGDFNQNGDLDGGELVAGSGNQWSTDLTLTTGDNLRLLVNGSEWWGPIKTVSPALPASLSMCGSAPASIADFHSGTFHVAFDADTLMLSITQTATNQFVAAGIAADSDKLATLSRQDVNLVRESASLYAANFWWTTNNGRTFTLSFSERDENGSTGGTYWSATSAGSSVLGPNVTTVTYTPVSNPDSVVRRTFRADTGMYRITFNPDTGVATLQRTYDADSGVNLLLDPSFETGYGWSGPYNAERSYSTTASENAAIHTGSGVGVLLPLQRHTQSGNYGSLSVAVNVSSNIGSNLKVTAWMRRLGEWNASRTRIWIEFKDTAWNTVGEKDFTVYDLSNFWKPYSLQAEIPEGTDKANILFAFENSQEGDGFVFVDDVEVRLVSGRNLDFDNWKQIESGGDFSISPPDWRGSTLRTTNNVSDAFVEAGSLFFSRYVEGSDNNKALEIYNPTANSVNLSGWTIEQYNNGIATNVTSFSLSGSIPTGGCFLITRPVAGVYSNMTPVAAELQAASDLQLPFTFNGDDVIVLRNPSGAVMDRIGEVRTNLTGSLLNYVLKDHTLHRSVYTSHGTTTNNLSETFPYAEWEIFPKDNFEGLKQHVRSIPSDVFIPSGLSLVFGPNGHLDSPSEPFDGGIGDVSFWYRTAFSGPENRTGSATLVLEASAEADFGTATEIATLVVPANQYAFTNFAIHCDLPEMTYFRIRQTAVTGTNYARIDDLSVGAPVPAERYQDFGLWTNNATWTNIVGNHSLAGWTLSAGKISASGGLSGSPAAVMPAPSGGTSSTVVSPVLEAGVGRIDFATRCDPDDEDSSDYGVTVEQSTDGGATWVVLGTVTNSGATWVLNTLTSGETVPVAIRFTSIGSGGLLIDNIDLRLPEGDSRDQSFDSWVQDNYGSSRHQGWYLFSGRVNVEDGVNGTKGLRMKDKNAYVQSAALQGGIGTLSFFAKPFGASHKPSFQVDISTDGGTNWRTVYTNRLDGSQSLEWQTVSVAINRENVTHVRILNVLAQSISLDSIVCGKIPVPPAIDIIPTHSPDPCFTNISFSLGAYVNPVGSATTEDIGSVDVDYKIRKRSRILEQGSRHIEKANSQGIWLTDKFPGQPDGITVEFTVRVAWTSNKVDTVSSASDDFLISKNANGGVWINEVVYAALSDYDGGSGGGQEGDPDDPWGAYEPEPTTSVGLENHEFVEICGPAGTDLTGWKLEFSFYRQADIAANGGKAVYATYMFDSATTIPTNAIVLANSTSTSTNDTGYGFFVVGDSNADWRVNVVLTTEVPDGFSTGPGDNIYGINAGIITLKDAQNVPVDSVVYNTSVTEGIPHSAHTIYTQGNNTSASAYGTNGYQASSFTWDHEPQPSPSPGEANPGQSFQPRPPSVLRDPFAYHDPAKRIVPDKAATASFFMLNPENATVNDDTEFVLGFDSAWGDNPTLQALLMFRLQGDDTYGSLPAKRREESKSGTNAFVSATIPAQTFKRLDTIEYYFVFNPDDSEYNDAFVAADAEAPYTDESEAKKHPFAYTFPFHDPLEFLSLVVPADPNALLSAEVYTPEYTAPPANGELSLEGNIDPHLATSNWFKLRLESVTSNSVSSDPGKGTYYTFEFERMGSPMFIRVAPAIQDAPAPTPDF